MLNHFCLALRNNYAISETYKTAVIYVTMIIYVYISYAHFCIFFSCNSVTINGDMVLNLISFICQNSSTN